MGVTVDHYHACVIERITEFMYMVAKNLPEWIRPAHSKAFRLFVHKLLVNEYSVSLASLMASSMVSQMITPRTDISKTDKTKIL